MTKDTSRRFRLTLAVTALLTVMNAAVPVAQQGPTLIDIVREATADFRDANAATAAGWQPLPACVSGPQEGAMGVHFVNGEALADPALDPTRPEALVYEQRGDRTRLVAVEFITIASDWHAVNPAPPVLLGQQFHYVAAPNRYGLPAFYELHVWAWRENPSGTFADFNPHVSCDGFTVHEPS